MSFNPHQIHINDLTEDCFLVIFSLIPNLRKKLLLRVVCKKWRSIIENSLIYHTRLTCAHDVYYDSEITKINEIKNLHHSINTLATDDQFIVELARYRISMSKIFLNYKNIKVFHIIKNPHFINIIYDWNLNDDNLQSLSLSLLEIKICNDEQLTDMLLSSLVSKCSKLETCEIINCSLLTGDFLYCLISANLKKLKLDRCLIDTNKLNNWILLNGQSIQALSISCKSVDIRLILHSINRVCDQLKELNLKNQNLISFSHSNWLLIGSLKLNKLIISDDFNLDNKILLAILNDQLVDLEIELLDELIDTSNKLTCFYCFNKKCPNLKNLTLINCNQIDMMHFYSLTYLEEISLINCYRLSNIFIDFVKDSKLKKLVLFKSISEEDFNKEELRKVAHDQRICLILD